MLTRGALNIIGGSPEKRDELERAQREVAEAVDREITALGIEHDSQGNRAKVYLYCLLAHWQEEGLVPDMAIEPGDKTDEPIRTRGWSYWHQLFAARDLLAHKTMRSLLKGSILSVLHPKFLDDSSRLCRWDKGHHGPSPQLKNPSSNRSLKTNCS